MEKKTGPAIITLTEGELAAFLEKNSPVVVGRFAAAQTAGSDFEVAANDADLEEFKFVQIVGPKSGITLHVKGLVANVQI